MPLHAEFFGGTLKPTRFRGSRFCNFSSILVYVSAGGGDFGTRTKAPITNISAAQKTGVSVHYCAEQFENDGSPMSSVAKTMKRTMAGEYSRKLSSKVFQGACRLIQMGFKQGGTAEFGLRRVLVDQSGQQKAVLKMGEHKSLQTDRVILIPGPEEEIKTVRWMYSAFVEGKANRKLPRC